MEIRKHEDFAPLAMDWQRVLAVSRAGHIFSTLAWKQTWWDVFANEAQLHLLSLHHANKCVALFPLLFAEGTLAFVGGQDLCDYLDFIIDKDHEEEAYEALFTYLDGANWQTIDLHSLQADSPTLRSVPAWAESRGYAVEVQEEDVCPATNLPANWDDYLQGLGKKDRHELRRKMRRLAAAGEVSYHRVADTHDLAADIEDFFRLHRLSREEKARFMTPQMERFFTEIVARFLPENRLRLYFMSVEGKRVAAVICFDEGKDLWLYNSGYDPAYASLSVGLLLKAFCVQQAIAEGKKRFDFLRGREPYKYDLGGKDIPIYRCLVRRS